MSTSLAVQLISEITGTFVRYKGLLYSDYFFEVVWANKKVERYTTNPFIGRQYKALLKRGKHLEVANKLKKTGHRVP